MTQPAQRGSQTAWKAGAAMALVAAAVVGMALLFAHHGRRESVKPPPANTTTAGPDVPTAIDPRLVIYREVRRFATGFRLPRGVAVGPDGLVWVAGDRGVRSFTQEGWRRTDIALEAPAACVAVSPAGTVYAGLRDHVEVFDAGGKRTGRWESLGPRAFLTAIAVDKKAVWLADAGNRVVLRCSPSGQVLGTLGKRDDARKVPGLLVPSPHLDVAPERGGLVWVSNPGRHRLEAYTPAGDLKRWWGIASAGIDGFCGCCNPTDFALLPDGGFVTSEKGWLRVKVFDAQERFRGMVALPTDFGKFQAGIDLAADAKGRIFALDPGACNVRIYERGLPATRGGAYK